MDRTERLLDLVALLLDAREPISWAELREAFPGDYGQGSSEASERKFERDKAELLELGIPISYAQGDDDRRDGYVVAKDAYYLPEVGLTPEELAVLYAAGSAALASEAFPGRQDLAHALRKIGFFSGGQLPTPRVRMELGSSVSAAHLSAHVEQLWNAAATRKWVQVTYRSPKGGDTERRVDPYGLALRGGVWSLVGHCHLRAAIRTFQVHRIQGLKVNPSRPRSADFEVPADFQLDPYVASFPWQHRFHAPRQVELRLRGALAARAEQAFPGAEVAAAGEEARVTLEVGYVDGLVRYALSLGAGCEVLGPPEVIARHRELAARILERHGGAGEGR